MDQKKRESDVELRPPQNPADRGTTLDPELNLRDRSNVRPSASKQEEESSD